MAAHDPKGKGKWVDPDDDDPFFTDARVHYEVDHAVERTLALDKQATERAITTLKKLQTLQRLLEERYPTRRYRDPRGYMWESRGEYEADQLWRQAAKDLGVEVQVAEVTTSEDEGDDCLYY